MGHMATASDISPDPAKVVAIQQICLLQQTSPQFVDYVALCSISPDTPQTSRITWNP